MLKIAIISDIHGNLPALKAVLQDIIIYGPTQIYCLGDLTDAVPWHNEVIQLIRNLNIPTIMGNHDERIAHDLPVYPLQKHSKEEQEARLAAINFTKETISPENKQFLAELPAYIKLQFGKVPVLLVHGSAESNDEYLYENHDEYLLKEMMQKHHAEVMICGHTHLSYIRYLSADDQPGKLVMNAGSVGRTKENGSEATYLQLNIADSAEDLNDLNPVIRKVPYQLEEVIAAIKSSPIPDFYADFFARKGV